MTYCHEGLHGALSSERRSGERATTAADTQAAVA